MWHGRVKACAQPMRLHNLESQKQSKTRHLPVVHRVAEPSAGWPLPRAGAATLSDARALPLPGSLQ